MTFGFKNKYKHLDLSLCHGPEPKAADSFMCHGLPIFRGPWNLSASYTGRFTDPDGESNIDDTLYQVSLGYEFDFGLAVDIGYGFTEEEDIDSHTVGLVFAYEFDLLVY